MTMECRHFGIERSGVAAEMPPSGPRCRVIQQFVPLMKNQLPAQGVKPMEPTKPISGYLDNLT
jgi:hypothetical protein